MPDTPQDVRIDPRWAWQPYRPGPDNPWDVRKVGHLYRRAGFGCTHAQLQAGLDAGPERTITLLLEGGPGQDAFENNMNSLVPGLTRGNSGPQATAWWLYRMVYSPHPLREKLTLFWHDHFATSNSKVNNVGLMIGQYQLLRRHAQGSFRQMLLDISEDPAMLLWLDTTTSRRGQANENYARELMELFSLGIRNYRNPSRNNYTERDIREAARAFTGYRIDNGRGVFRPKEHDDTEKTVLGQTGRWRGPDIVRICLEQESAPYFLLGKLFQYFINERLRPSAELLQPLANQLRRNNYDFGPIVQQMLRSTLFFSSHAYRTKIKSPAEFAIGIVRALEGRIGTVALGSALEGLGQRLFYPPSVAGWDEGEAWLNGQTLLFRHNLALGLTSTLDDRFGRRADPAVLARNHRLEGDAPVVDFFLNLFLQGDVAADTRTRLLDYYRQARLRPTPSFWTPRDGEDQRLRALAHLVLTLPEYQIN